MRTIIEKSNLATLARIGLAAEYYPEFHSERPLMHGVDVVLLSVILRGRGIHYLGTENWQEDGGSVAITHYGEEHAIVTAPGERMEIMNLYLDLKHFTLPLLPESLAACLACFLPTHPALCRGGHRLTRILFPSIDAIEPLVRGIERELRAGAPGHLIAAQDYFRLFLIECCRRALDGGVTHCGSVDPAAWRLEKVCRHLTEHYASAHSLDQLARLSGLQRNYLCRKFRQHTGRSIVQYLQEQRIRQAVRLLHTTGEKTLAIAAACGFADVNYFNRTFRALIGCTPTQFRRRATGTNADSCKAEIPDTPPAESPRTTG